MKLASLASLLFVALAAAAGCAGSTEGEREGSSEQDVSSSIALGTYTIDSRPWFGGTYATRLTLKEGKKFEAEMVSSGRTSLIAGSYTILPARPNDPQSPVRSDKPTLYMTPDNDEGPAVFEFDKLASGGLRLYHSARSVSFTMKLDPTFRPPATNAKKIKCTGPQVDALITLDEAQNRRGTLELTRKAGADRHDPPSVEVAITQVRGSEVPGYLYYEGSSGEQDYYVDMIETDFDRGRGNVMAHLHWAEGGQEFDIGGTCAFE